MMRIQKLGWVLFAALLGGEYRGMGAEPTGAELIEQAMAAYRALPTYQGDIVVSRTVKMQETEATTLANCSVRLEKPDRYLITWQSNAGGRRSDRNDYTLWREGADAFLYLRLTGNYYAMASDELALASASGLSGGAVPVVLSLLLDDDSGGTASVAGLESPKLLRSEFVGGEDCHVVSGNSLNGMMEMTLWISKENALIWKCATSLSPGGDLIESVKGLNSATENFSAVTGQDLPEEQKQYFDNVWEQSKKMLKSGGLHVESTEECLTQTSPEFEPRDLRFVPPEGAVLKDSILADSFESLGNVLDSMPDDVKAGILNRDEAPEGKEDESMDGILSFARLLPILVIAVGVVGFLFGGRWMRRQLAKDRE